nr:helix-turn-helix domain-containing protein [Methanothermus fervidus]
MSYIYTYKSRLYPSKEQEDKLLKSLEICRNVYNYFLTSNIRIKSICIVLLKR